MTLKISRRKTDRENTSFSPGIPPLLQRIYAARGITSDSELEYSFSGLYDYKKIKGIDKAAMMIADAIMARQRIIVVGDFDADGATSCALAITALRQFDAFEPSYLVPDRFEYGYGLTPEIVSVAAKSRPDLLVTVDNGISCIEGVQAAKRHGMQVIVTDHHLAGDSLPEADAIVNPNQPGCLFAGKNTAGVGVIFYTMCAVRSRLESMGWFAGKRSKPNMATLLDLVCFGTVADVVSLDRNNRILVAKGLQRIRAGHVRPGIQALIEVSGRSYHRLTTSDIGFGLAPRLNAAGRLDDMSVGIELLLCQEMKKARQLAESLDQLNRERREIETGMHREAFERLKTLSLSDDNNADFPCGLCFYQPDWHPGVIGIVASRIKEKTHRPVVVFAQGDQGLIKGSARSVSGFHIRDALAMIHSRFPSLLCAYGGHAMAAGLTIRECDFEQFRQAFQQIAEETLTEEQLSPFIMTDGELAKGELVLSSAELLHDGGPWGQNFPEPVFDGRFNVVSQKLIKDKHLKMTVTHPEDNRWIDAILFNADTDVWPNHEITSIKAVYQLCSNEFNGSKNVQLLLRQIEPV